ncbi:MAG TPA: papain-like cysteine protease family protein [Vicinamibacterales bacterium]|nr:papain-like cysteine protease family protein [Vicinamibacterales bacterium]
MTRELRAAPRLRTRQAALLALAFSILPSQARSQSLTILDVPFVAQSELLCGGAAAAMVMRYWGERGVDAEAFQPLVDSRAGGIRTDALAAALRARNWNTIEVEGSADALARQLQQGRPVIALLEDRPGTYHYVVVVAESGDGVVFHDPARAPFRVASAANFDKRWSASGHWMLVVTPAARDTPAAQPPAAAPATPCEQQVAEGVRQAQQNDLDAADRTLASAISCPGDAAFRELAGVRVLQRRWPEAADLAAAALARDPSDEYASKLLATARFVGDDPLGALDAWNQAREPRIDLIRVSGLTRTRQKVVEHAIGLNAGETLTRGALLRGRRRLNELPATPGALDYSPVPSGLAEVRATVAERPLVPHGAFDLGVLALATSVTRELAATVSSPTGGGEQVGVDWRFWAHRPLYQLSVTAPAPWRGVWRVAVSRERQPFTAIYAPTLHDSLQLDVADWASGNTRWNAGAGLDRWNRGRTFGSAVAGVRLVSSGSRLDAGAQVRTWFGGGKEFERAELRVAARSSVQMTGVVLVVDAGAAAVNASAPPDLWVAGDTGRARPFLLRAHPILGGGEAFRTERLGRLFVHESTEVQRWWSIGPFRAAVASFVDTGRTARRLRGDPFSDVDLGIGLRGAYPGRAGALRLDLAHGLRDGQTAVSAIYTADIGR